MLTLFKKMILLLKQILRIPFTIQKLDSSISGLQMLLKDFISDSNSFSRKKIASAYLKGNGLEVGALHNPLPYPTGAHVQYVDRMTVEDLRKHYPELASLDLVTVDIIDDGERLLTIANESQDFIIANHMLEHCRNPIQTLENFFMKLKDNGILYLAIPDKRFTFDRERELTSFEHLLEDYKNPTLEKDHEHFVDYCQKVEKITNPQELEKKVKQIEEMDYSIHFHVWDANSFLNFLISTLKFLTVKFEILFFYSDQREEVISILRKI